ncbi:MAG: glycosyltransferase family 2 protein [Armatimonadetes bacterium]|nr:glycosyltransferase family 2 protein [Armatimonadota bacterium]
MKTLIIMPARNEEQTIGLVIAKLKSLLPNIDILVVNDASTDKTAEVALKAGTKVVNLPINLGYGGAVQTGFKYAVKKGYDVIVLMDADGQHEPACVPDLLEALKDADFVLGSRFLGNCNYKVPFARRVGMWLFGKIVNWVTGQKITDPTSGFQAMKRKVVEFLSGDHYPVDFPDADVLILLHRAGFQIKEIPVVMHQRLHGVSMHSHLKAFYYVFKMSLSILATLMRTVPRK